MGSICDIRCLLFREERQPQLAVALVAQALVKCCKLLLQDV